MFEIFTNLFQFFALQFLQISKNIHAGKKKPTISYSRRLPAELIDEMFKFCTHKRCAELSNNSKTKSRWLSSLAKYRADRFHKDSKRKYAPNNWLLNWLLHPFRFATVNHLSPFEDKQIVEIDQQIAEIDKRITEIDKRIAENDKKIAKDAKRIRHLQKLIQHEQRLRNRKQWNRRRGGCKWRRRF